MRCLAFSDSVLVVRYLLEKFTIDRRLLSSTTARPQNRISNGRKPAIKRHFFFSFCSLTSLSFSLCVQFSILRFYDLRLTGPSPSSTKNTTAPMQTVFAYYTRVFVTIPTTLGGGPSKKRSSGSSPTHARVRAKRKTVSIRRGAVRDYIYYDPGTFRNVYNFQTFFRAESETELFKNTKKKKVLKLNTDKCITQ